MEWWINTLKLAGQIAVAATIAAGVLCAVWVLWRRGFYGTIAKADSQLLHSYRETTDAQAKETIELKKKSSADDAEIKTLKRMYALAIESAEHARLETEHVNRENEILLQKLAKLEVEVKQLRAKDQARTGQ